jgi:predicted nucleic-acid-binding protein
VIALDTNVIVRFLVQDDEKQGTAAKRLFEGLTEANPGYISREVVIEVVWVLERAYKLSRRQIVPAIEGLISSRELTVENAARVGHALNLYQKGGAGFSDRMILLASQDAQCSGLATFDKILAKDQGVTLL